MSTMTFSEKLEKELHSMREQPALFAIVAAPTVVGAIGWGVKGAIIGSVTAPLWWVGALIAYSKITGKAPL